jgi:membrane-bound lytic murein transglycosylase D
MRFGTVLLATILATVTPVPATHAASGDDDARRQELFPRPAELAPQVRFWRAVFAEYSSHQVVLHDALHLDKVYKVLDLRPRGDGEDGAGQVSRLERIDADLELERVRATLLRLHALGPHPEGLTDDERAVYDLFQDDPAPDRFLAAADSKRLRSQRGLRERFGEGIRMSRRYLPEMERIFREHGVPVELTRVPLIESCFNLHAYSKVGAAGIWQFMPATGRLFMRVDNLVDERRDPIAATRAAARFLDQMHDHLDTWPLTITAYNHGPEGMARAVRETGSTDIATIVHEYRGRAFGFASRNFYAEFLAALDIESDYREHFGDLPLDSPLRAREHRLERAVGIQTAARLAHTNADELASLNPALCRLITDGRRPIPAGYRLRVPESAASGFEDRLAGVEPESQVIRAAAPAPAHRPAARPAVVTHRVRPGQTLSHIAKQHRVTVARLRGTNRIGRAEHLRPGQVLRIPVPQTAM